MEAAEEKAAAADAARADAEAARMAAENLRREAQVGVQALSLALSQHVFGDAWAHATMHACWMQPSYESSKAQHGTSNIKCGLHQ
jgi:LDH2 family malate/lactate/ureidoglycolate dehydrogenase